MLITDEECYYVFAAVVEQSSLMKLSFVYQFRRVFLKVKIMPLLEYF